MQEALQFLMNDRLDDLFEDECIAADIPAGLQADAGVGLPHARHAIDVIVSVLPGGDQAPVLFLPGLSMRDVRLVLEEAGRMRVTGDLVIEGVECATQYPADERLDAGEAAQLRGVETDELQSVLEIG